MQLETKVESHANLFFFYTLQVDSQGNQESKGRNNSRWTRNLFIKIAWDLSTNCVTYTIFLIILELSCETCTISGICHVQIFVTYRRNIVKQENTSKLAEHKSTLTLKQKEYSSLTILADILSLKSLQLLFPSCYQTFAPCHCVIWWGKVTQTSSGSKIIQPWHSPVQSRHFVAGNSNA